jgi:hypothetical protein
MSVDQTEKNNPRGSIVLFALGILSLALALLNGVFLGTALVRSKLAREFGGESLAQAQGFSVFAAVGLGVLIFLSAFLPAMFRLKSNPKRRDRLSFSLSLSALLILLLTILVAVGTT